MLKDVGALEFKREHILSSSKRTHSIIQYENTFKDVDLVTCAKHGQIFGTLIRGGGSRV